MRHRSTQDQLWHDKTHWVVKSSDRCHSQWAWYDGWTGNTPRRPDKSLTSCPVMSLHSTEEGKVSLILAAPAANGGPAPC